MSENLELLSLKRLNLTSSHQNHPSLPPTSQNRPISWIMDASSFHHTARQIYCLTCPLPNPNPHLLPKDTRTPLSWNSPNYPKLPVAPLFPPHPAYSPGILTLPHPGLACPQWH
ncbi:hypothetical protein SKAU_G00332590 [Synaphobranchus kaupii]|uniref:Uncharacterized protein n=1 Tax=Synaphobranchus kaupii TaxID=118154 RepID=A0A9Q1ELG3_SYNKA|nr:hypothetical protein SKAU_G00332590 [Synaphobranchus kaupii]